jgi:tetratricopeptide (TPR) repeat protein/transglutaminase-like putative cysteine protease
MSSKRWVSALLFAAIAFSSAHTQTKATVKLSPDTPDFSKEAYVIERLSSRIKLENDGTGTREVAAEVKVLADAGVKAFAVLNFTYTSANEVVEIDYVRVRKPDGTVVKTPDYNIQDMPGEVTRTAPLYSDIHEKHVAVKGLGVGDVLEYLARYRIIKPQVAGQFWQEYSFAKDSIDRDERVEISVPSGKYVKIVSPEFKPEITTEGDQKIYHWTHSNLIVKQKDPGEIPRRIPPNPDVQVTTFASWEDVGRWYGDLQKDSLQVTPAIQSKANELTKGLKTDDEKIQAIYRFVALKFHYIGLDFGIGRYQPHAADDVLDNGYGDCKDKHTLLATMLQAVGIDAWPALIHATRKLDPEVPSPAQFNHVITVVPRGDKFLWLDTTPEVSPYGLLLTTLRGKQALVIPASKLAMLMTTPANPPFPQLQEFSMEGKLNPEGTFSGHAQQSYRGDVEVALRAAFRQVSQSQWKEAVQRFSYGLNFAGDVSNVNLTPPDDLSKSFGLSYDYERKNYGDWENRQIGPPMPPMGIEMTKDSKKPPEPVLLGGLGEVVYETKMILPEGYSGSELQNVDLVRPYAEYHSVYNIENGVFSATRRLVIKKNEVELSSWEDFRDFGKAISDDENRYVRLSGGTGINGSRTTIGVDLDQEFRDASLAMQKGDSSRAQELFEKVISRDSKYPMAHLNLGTIFMMENRLTEAIAEWNKEQEANPTDIRVFHVPATYLTQMNRRDDAIQAWRKVLKLDPKNHDAALNLSSLLASEDKNTEAAMVLEDAVKGSPDSASLNMALGEVYVKSGQADRGMPFMEKAMQGKGIDSATLNDAAYILASHNTHLEQAKEFAEKAVADMDASSVQAVQTNDDNLSLILCTEFSAAWDTLGWVYFQMGDLKRAEGYLTAAWSLGQNAVSGDHLGQTLAKLEKKKKAAHIYELALQASSVRTTKWGVNMQDPPSVYQERHSQLLAHYEKLTGRRAPPMISIDRLPNGQWTKTPADELRDARHAVVSKTSEVAGEAEFAVVFAPGKVESVTYRGGDDQLKPITEKVKAASFLMAFPSGSGAKIVRHVKVTCTSSSGCNAEMLPPGLVTFPKR